MTASARSVENERDAVERGAGLARSCSRITSATVPSVTATGKEKKIWGPACEIGRYVAQVPWQEFLADVRYAEKQIDLGGDPHHPEDKKCPQTHGFGPLYVNAIMMIAVAASAIS